MDNAGHRRRNPQWAAVFQYRRHRRGRTNCAAFQPSRPRFPGLVAYVMIGLREACRYAALDYEVELDGTRSSVRALLIAFANGREHGNSLTLCGGAELDDGLLDATVIQDRPVASRCCTRGIWPDGAPSSRRASSPARSSAVVRASTTMEYHLDGEPGSADVIEIEHSSGGAEGARLDPTSGGRRLEIRPGNERTNRRGQGRRRGTGSADPVGVARRQPGRPMTPARLR